jgi:prepilin-type processing-associated H-X9-DG protein
MRKSIGTIGATLAVIAAMATTAGLAEAHNHREATKILKDPTADNTDVYTFIASDAPFRSTHSGGATFGLADGSVRNVMWSVPILPYIEQENLYRLSGAVNSSMGDGTVRFVRDSIAQQTWTNADSPSDAEVLGADW